MPSNTKEEVLQKLRQSLSQVESAIEQIERRRPDDPRFEEDLSTLALKRSELQHKIVQFTVPPIPASVSVSPPPVTPAAPPANPAPANSAPDDFSPLSFFGWTFGAVTLLGLVVWGLQSKENLNHVRDIVHIGNRLLKSWRHE